LAETAETLLGEMNVVLSLATEHFKALGLLPAMATGNAGLFVATLPPADGEKDRTERARVVTSALELMGCLASRENRDERIGVQLCPHVGTLLLSDCRAVGGDLLRLSAWLPEGEHSGVLGTLGVFEGLDIATDAIEGSLLRVRGV